MHTRYAIARPQVMVLDSRSGSRYSRTTRRYSHESRQYFVHDSPAPTSIREKLARQGIVSLSTAELVSLILAGGTDDEKALELANQITREYGEKSIMKVREPEVMAKELSVSTDQAVQIIACAELGRRFYEKNTASAPVIRSAEDVYAYVKDMHDLPKEHLRGLYLNAHYKVIHSETLSIGTIDSSIIHPREVFKPALEYGAIAVVLVHNHPSGESTPSDADIRITNQLLSAGKLLGVELVDHVIVTKDTFLSIPADYLE